MKNRVVCALSVAIAVFAGSSVLAGDLMPSGMQNAVSNALNQEPTFKEGGHKGKIGYYFTRFFKMDWPVTNKMIRDTWDIDPKQDTDGDGTPDVDDEDIDGDGKDNSIDRDVDGDGVPNKKDKNPYDSTVQFSGPPGHDSDHDGIPDELDTYPQDPDRSFQSDSLERKKNQIKRYLW